MKVPRKLDQLTRFFKEVMANPKVSLRTRMEAARRLDTIYERYAAMQEKAEMRKERAETRAAAQQSPAGGIPTQESALEITEIDAETEADEDERLASVFDSILGRGVSADDTDSE